jgi:hypothetical protein
VRGSVDLGHDDDAVVWGPADLQPAAQELLAAAVCLSALWDQVAEQFLGKRREETGGGQMRAYTSAESKKLTPASKAVSRRRIELAAPFCCPMVIVPART